MQLSVQRDPLSRARSEVTEHARQLERLKDGIDPPSAWREFTCGDRADKAVEECAQGLDYWQREVARLEANGGTA